MEPSIVGLQAAIREIIDREAHRGRQHLAHNPRRLGTLLFRTFRESERVTAGKWIRDTVRDHGYESLSELILVEVDRYFAAVAHGGGEARVMVLASQRV